MLNRKSLVIIGLVVIVITGGALYLASRSRETEAPDSGPQPKADTKKPAAPLGVQIRGAELEDRGPDGELRWKVTASGELEFDKEREVVVGKQVKFVLTQPEQTPVEVEAPHFTADYTQANLVFEQGVKGRFTDGTGSFAASRVEYQMSTSKLLGSGGVRFEQGAYTATADTLVVDTINKKVRLRGKVRFTASGRLPKE